MKKINVINVVLVIIVALVIAIFFLLACVRKDLDQRSTSLEIMNQEKSQCLETLRSYNKRGFIDNDTYNVVTESLNDKDGGAELIDRKSEIQLTIKIIIGSIMVCVCIIFLKINKK